jgi:plastocyanin
MSIHLLLFTLWLFGSTQASYSSGDQTPKTQRIVIKSVEYQLRFDVETFTVKAGSNVELYFENVDEMPHNLLILKPGSLDKVGKAADEMTKDPNSAKKHFVPKMPEVLFSTPLVMFEESYTLRFKAPSTPGSYPYVCTYPGHWRSMNGVMKVVR